MITEIKRNLRLRGITFCLTLGQTTGDKSGICAAIVIAVVTAIIRYFRHTFATRGWIRYNRPSPAIVDRSPAHLGRCWKVQRAEGKARRLTSPLGMRLNWCLSCREAGRYSAFNSGAGYEDPERILSENPRGARGRDFSRAREDPRLQHQRGSISRLLRGLAIHCLSRFIPRSPFSSVALSRARSRLRIS